MPLTFFQNTFAGNPLNRASDRRPDAEWLAGQLASSDSLGLALWNGKPLIEKTKEGGVQIAYLPAKLASELAGGEERLLFMGLWQETAVFAVDMEGTSDPAQGPLQGLGEFQDLRMIALRLPATDAAMLATAKSMFEWRRRHQYCAACGQPSEAKDGGWKRQCPSCQVEHFPRTDPVVIMLVTSGEKCLLGRQKQFPPGMWSCLAGFVEVAETIEDAVRREILEESGIVCSEVGYYLAQPWPYPSSLMIGCTAVATTDEIIVDRMELEDARWFSRDDARLMLKREHPDGHTGPHPVAIAHHLLGHWLQD